MYKIPILGTENSKQLFKDIFDFYIANIDSLALGDVDSIETNLNAYDITPKHYIANNLKRDINLETPRIYRKVEDSSMVLLTEYYYTSKANKVEIITFNWKENVLFDKGLSFFSKQELQRQNLLAERMNWVKAVISDRFGKAVNDMQGKNFRDINWEQNGLIINLHGNFMNSPKYYNSVELTFYKK